MSKKNEKSDVQPISAMKHSVLEFQLILNYLLNEFEYPAPRVRGTDFDDPLFEELDRRLTKSKFNVLIQALEQGVRNLRCEFNIDDDAIIEQKHYDAERGIITLADKVRSLRDDGSKYREISDMLGIPVTTINNIIRGFKPWREGIGKKAKGWLRDPAPITIVGK